MSDYLYNAACNFEKAIKNSYELTVGNRKRLITLLIPSVNSSEFTHILGLDHLSDIKVLNAQNSTQKSAVFKKILSNKITFDDISNSQYLNSPIAGSHNYRSNSEYTVNDRIKFLSDFENIMDNFYNRKVYKWNLSKCRIKLPNGNFRKTTINADYLITVPFKESNETIYLFAYQTNKYKSKSEPILLNIFSAFPDGIDLTSGQDNPYTILEEKKNNVSIYIHPSYKKELEKNTTQSKPQQNDNIKKIKFDSPAPQNIVHSSSGAAAAVMPKPDPFKNIFEKIKSSIKIFFRLQDKPTKQPSLPLNTVSKTDNITDKTQSDTDIKAFSENNFSKELKLLNEARRALANKDIQKNEYTKALIFYIKSLDSEEKTEEAIKNLVSLSSELPPSEKIFIKNEIYNVRHYLIEKYRPNEKSWLDTLKNAKAADKAEMSKEQGISEKENYISKNDCIR